MRVQMMGLCRFSYLGGRGFQVEHETIEQRRAFLYDPDRLERRWQWFEAVCLPGLMNQTDPDFTLVLMTGPDLPDPWMSRLREVCEAMPQARLSLVPPMQYHLQACKHALAPHKDAGADVIGHFRQDDDDAVGIDFVERARNDFPLVEPVWRQKRAASIIYMRGMVLKAGPNGVEVIPRMVYNPPGGMAVYLPPQDTRSATQLPHWRMGHYMPTLYLPDQIMFCRLLNHDNDSGAVGPGYDFDEDPPDMAAMMMQRFAVSLPDISALARAHSLPPAARPHWGNY